MKTYTVYRIYNSIEGKSYIGVTANMGQRISYHFARLSGGAHDNRSLQDAYDRCGKPAFTVQVIEERLTQDESDIREIFWIAAFEAYCNGYNGTPGRATSRWGRKKQSS